jgi:hypothetical protein
MRFLDNYSQLVFVNTVEKAYITFPEWIKKVIYTIYIYNWGTILFF